MSADGEVEVSVRAEGVDQAAGEMAGETLTQTGDGAAAAGPPGGGGGRGGAGRFGKLLTRIATLLAFLGPILKVLGVASNILEAFVAPLAIVLLRLLQPALRLLIQVLPVWFDIVDRVGDILMKAQDMNLVFPLPLGLLQLIDSGVAFVDQKLSDLLAWGDNLIKDIQALPGRIWSFVQRLPSQIGMAINDQLPDIPGTDLFGGGGDGGGGGFALSDIRDALGGGGDTRDRQPRVNLGGGLSAFVDRVERDPNTELQ